MILFASCLMEGAALVFVQTIDGMGLATSYPTTEAAARSEFFVQMNPQIRRQVNTFARARLFSCIVFSAPYLNSPFLKATPLGPRNETCSKQVAGGRGQAWTF